MISSDLLVAGVDEAGRGPWAGPVTAAAVILDPASRIEGLTDSKRLTEARREKLAPIIRETTLAWCVAHASPDEIDRLNIREATFLAMQRAIMGLSTQPHRILVDGNALPETLPCPAEAIVKGDLKEPAISAASILAKTTRDQIMREMDTEFPAYGFASHKGYGTAAHADALGQFGPCVHHRHSFSPVRNAVRG